MSQALHVWYYVKDFAIFHTKYNKSYIPYELIHYIYTYVISDEIKQNINNNYIFYNLNKQLYNNNNWCYVKGSSFVTGSNFQQEISFHRQNLPYFYLMNNEQLLWKLTEMVKYKNYTDINVTEDGKEYASFYYNVKLNKNIDYIHKLSINLYSN